MVPGVHHGHLKGIGEVRFVGGKLRVVSTSRPRREFYNRRVFGIKSGVMPYIKWQECA
jgi:hypothetical protein